MSKENPIAHIDPENRMGLPFHAARALDRRKDGDPNGEKEFESLDPEARREAIKTARFKEGDEMKNRLLQMLDRLEGKLDPEKMEQLKNTFLASLVSWEAAGLFSQERESQGYQKPDFERDYLPMLGVEDMEMMKDGPELNRGYNRAVWAPMDAPLASKNPEDLSYFKILKEALLKAYEGNAGGKQPNTLLVGPEKRVLTSDQIDLNAILWKWDRYLKKGVVHNPKQLDPKNHGGLSEAELLAGLRGTEKKTGGVFRLERDRLIMPKDVGNEEMSALNYHGLNKTEKGIPSHVEFQNIKQDIAHVIHCLNTQGWIPDYYDGDNVADSHVNLALNTFIPDESKAGAVAASYWGVYRRKFRLGGDNAADRNPSFGVRVGVRKNNEAA
jgi:hypothetical protein